MIPSSTPLLRRLGSSELMLSPLGLGCWQFSNNKGLVGKFWPALEPESVEKIIRISLEGGINWFDTAEIYGGGRSEEILSRTLASIATREAQDTPVLRPNGGPSCVRRVIYPPPSTNASTRSGDGTFTCIRCISPIPSPPLPAKWRPWPPL